MQLQSGSLLQGGKYRIERVLGQGGFGITYQAVQVALNRKVAIKEFFMKEYCNRDSETSHVSIPSEGSKELVGKFRQKFIKEAQNIAALNHPHIIRIHDIFEENGTAYYVMEYCDKGSLGDLVKRQGALDESEALRYIRQVADALGYIHERKMNHLDVKPGNILLDENRNAVLIDFGLSKRYDEEGNQTSTTPVGISHGYAPLEQYKKGGVGTFSPATDIYSLGATLYKLLTGQTPPEANDVMDDGLPALPSSVSSATVSAIEKAMQSSRKNRPQSVKELLGMLDEVPVFNGLEDTILVDEVLETDKEWNICGTEPLPVGFQLRSGSFVYEIVECLSKDACSYVYKAIRKGQEDEDVILLENMPNEFMGGRVGDSSGEYEIDFSISDYDEWRGLFDEKVKRLSKSCKVLERFEVGYATALVSFSAPIRKELLDACMMKKKVNESYGESVPAPSPISSSSSWKKWAVPLAACVLVALAVIARLSTSQPASASSSSSNVINGHEYVDLGLSVKWADRNVGASSPSDYGSYFAWGETSTKSDYSWDTYRWCKGTEESMTKYCTNSKYGTVDNRKVLESSDDVARVKWGGSWRMPTKEEFKELCDKCIWTWTTQGGHDGYKVTGPNGNSIFLPAAGHRYDTDFYDRGSDGYYWSATLYEYYSYRAYYLDFSSGGHGWNDYYRKNGLTVRPVTE